VSEDWQEISKHFNDVMKRVETEQEVFWNTLTKEEQLKAFCAVSRRIYQAEIVDQGSYRHALYTVFGFGPEAYAQAQLAYYLAIHNSIIPEDYDQRLLSSFCEKYNISEYQDKIDNFLYNLDV